MKKLLITFLTSILVCSLFAEPRNALLIANSRYKNFGSLSTPVNEAAQLKATLEKLDFNVQVVNNASREQIIDSLYDFENKLARSGGIGFFHYGGHAVQVNGKNYIIPVDADIPDERKVDSRAVNIDEIMTSMQADTNIVILDACRNNPLPASSGRSATRGLVLSESKPKNSIIVYSAQPGKVAQDGVFTPILTQKLLQKKSFNEVLMDVRREVRAKTNNEQSPGEYNELESSIYLAGYANPNPVNTTSVKSDFVVNNKSFDKNAAGAAYNEGLSLLKSNQIAAGLEKLEKAISLGSGAAANDLGVYYSLGSYGLPKDKSKGIYYYELAEKLGNPQAMSNLGWDYLNGTGVQQNDSIAFSKFKASYELKNNDGSCGYAWCYIYGRGTSIDYAKARSILESVNSPYSYYLQGYMNEYAMGVPKNYSAAYALYSKSTDSRAAKQMENIKKYLEPVDMSYSKMKDHFSMIKVKGGTYKYNNSFLTPKITLSDFMISTSEVTRDLYGKVMNVAWGGQLGKVPATNISWYNSIVFCNKLSIMDGLTPCYSINGSTNPDTWGMVPTENNSTWNNVQCNFNANGYRLLTNAEWTYAAKEGNMNSNYKYCGSDDMDAVTWNWRNSSGNYKKGDWSADNSNGGNFHQVCTKSPNVLGLYDMSGNASEYVWDWKSDKVPVGENPTGPSEGTLKAVRGGDYWQAEVHMEIDFHDFWEPYRIGSNFGFRIGRSVR